MGQVQNLPAQVAQPAYFTNAGMPNTTYFHSPEYASNFDHGQSWDDEVEEATSQHSSDPQSDESGPQPPLQSAQQPAQQQACNNSQLSRQNGVTPSGAQSFPVQAVQTPPIMQQASVPQMQQQVVAPNHVTTGYSTTQPPPGMKILKRKDEREENGVRRKNAKPTQEQRDETLPH